MTGPVCPACNGTTAERVGEQYAGGGYYETIYEQCSHCNGTGMLDPDRYCAICGYWRAEVGESCAMCDEKTTENLRI